MVSSEVNICQRRNVLAMPGVSWKFLVMRVTNHTQQASDRDFLMPATRGVDARAMILFQEKILKSGGPKYERIRVPPDPAAISRIAAGWMALGSFPLRASEE
jgi:hypothetical protein